MQKKEKLSLSGIILALSIWGGVNSFNRMMNAEEKLMINSDYREAIRLNDTSSKLNSARVKLNYNPAYIEMIPRFDSDGKKTNIKYIYIPHPEENPDAKDAKNLINNAVRNISDRKNLCEKLNEVTNSLPDENDVKSYRGKKVDDSTFSVQKNSLEIVSQNLSLLADESMEKVPKDLKKEERNSILALIGCISAAFGSLFYGLNNIAPSDE